MIDSIPIKLCPKCQLIKSTTEFYNRRGQLGNSSYCKQCSNSTALRRQQENKRRAIEYLGGRCRACDGVFHQAAFDFHHLNPRIKDRDIRRILSRKWENIVAELDKCVLNVR